jgi:hypothetical protein
MMQFLVIEYMVQVCDIRVTKVAVDYPFVRTAVRWMMIRSKREVYYELAKRDHDERLHLVAQILESLLKRAILVLCPSYGPLETETDGPKTGQISPRGNTYRRGATTERLKTKSIKSL